MSSVSTDRIHKQIVLHAPRARVWAALIEPQQFGQWFGVDLDHVASLAPGQRVQGRLRDPNWAHVPFEFTVERIEPERYLSWRWYPQHAIEPKATEPGEPSTLVEFELRDHPDGVLLVVVESGIDGLPARFRDAIYRGNGDGWAQQLQNIQRYLAH